MTANCENHAFETAEDICGNCGRPFCPDCVVYPWGPKKSPLCKACAIGMAGIRKHATRPPVASKRQLKRIARERRRTKAAQAAAPTREPVISGIVDWDEVDDPTRPAAEPLLDAPEAVPAGVGGFGMDDADLQEVRPSFDARLSRVDR